MSDRIPVANITTFGELSELYSILKDVYTPEGVSLWIAHADKQGWPYEERLQRALNAADGNFS